MPELPLFFRSVSLSEVVLRVHHLDAMLTFYRDLLGFLVVRQDAGRVELSANGQEPALLVLERAPQAGPKPPGSSGLFHAAFLYPDRGSLGRVARHLLSQGIDLATGDHGVSEALYLDDPEGNGIELYADRPTESWPKSRAAGDRVGMYTEAVDLAALIRSSPLAGGPLMPPDTRLGHVHLSVAHLNDSEQFYGKFLGFDTTVRSISGALFLSRDGYHHQLGVNVWRSSSPVVKGSLGLACFTLQFVQSEEFARVSQACGKETSAGPDGMFRLNDPSGIEIKLLGPAG